MNIEKSSIEVLQDMGIKGILFDKDGTLLDFNKTWRPVLEDVIQLIIENFQLDVGIKEEIFKILGVTEDGFKEDSIYLTGAMGDIVKELNDKLNINPSQKEKILISLASEADTFFEKKEFKMHLFDGVEETVRRLKSMGFVVGIATSDTAGSVEYFLRSSGLIDLFDFIGCDDGTHKVKPASDILDAFCDTFDLEPVNVAMIGDSIIDMEFALNNGIGCGIYVRSSYPSEDAEKMAHMILDDVTHLFLAE